MWNNNNRDRLKEYQNTFRNKQKEIYVDLTNIDIDCDDTQKENIQLQIEDIYHSDELIEHDTSLIYELFDEQINYVTL